jgi:hypothetical protein
MKNKKRLTRQSYYLLSGFFLTIGLIIIVWWPLVKDYFSLLDPEKPLFTQIDWLLIGIFVCMSALIVMGADLKKDIWVIVIGAAGGFIIESWGTNTGLWHYFTGEKPPLWIIPAWPIAALSITRLTNIIDNYIKRWQDKPFHSVTLFAFFAFFLMTTWFIRWTLKNPISILVLCLMLLLILVSKADRRLFLFFMVGSFAGIFLEVWGTTRECWTYYTHEMPPVFAIFAHGFAAVAFFRMELIIKSHVAMSRNILFKLRRYKNVEID